MTGGVGYQYQLRISRFNIECANVHNIEDDTHNRISRSSSVRALPTQNLRQLFFGFVFWSRRILNLSFDYFPVFRSWILHFRFQWRFSERSLARQPYRSQILNNQIENASKVTFQSALSPWNWILFSSNWCCHRHSTHWCSAITVDQLPHTEMNSLTILTHKL